MSKALTFKISIPTQNGFFGRECNNPACKRYFKIHQNSLMDKMYCPYCSLLFNKNELLTHEQLKYAQKNAEEEAMAHVSNELDNMLEKTFGKQSGSNKKGFLNISVSYKPGSPYRKKCISPPTEKEVDSEIECSECKAKFQVYGIFGYCPLCKCDNIMIYDTNISIILAEIENASDKNRALRHAYNDMVATFENFCKKKNQTEKKYNFQNLDSSARFVKDIFNKDIFDGLQNDEILTIKRLYQKRHVYQHNKGVIDQKYIDVIPEDVSLLGQVAPLDIEEFRNATTVMRKILLNRQKI
jgi:hypothetical protein